MTNQEAFDLMVAHLRKQNAFSFNLVGDCWEGPIYQCAYRGADGCKCAVGALIPDDLYDPEFENITPVTDRVRTPLKWGEVFTNFLMAAQYHLHDSLWSGETDHKFDLKEFEHSARNFAAAYNLKYRPPVEKV